MLGDKIITGAFLISLSGHLLLLGMPGLSLSSLQTKKPEEIVVKIEIEKPSLLPNIDVMGKEKKLREETRSRKPETRIEPKPQPEKIIVVEEPIKESESPKELVKTINPQDEAMLRYQDMVKQRIEEVRRYPSWAKKREIEGITYINFVVLPNGSSRNIRTIRSSGSKILDEEAVGTIKRANPFPPIPQELNQNFVLMDVTIVFKIK